MIDNNYDREEAIRWRREAGDDPADQELAERVYTSRLIGRNPDLVMHGGGNTSVKVKRRDLYGDEQAVVHIKGSGWDLGAVEADGMPGVWLDPLLRQRQLNGLSDREMISAQRAALLDASAPNPSIETLLHAFLPHTYVDHTHATPFLVLANLPNAEEVCREIFGGRVGVVPYMMPGFALDKRAAEVFDENPDMEGLLLLNHGHVAFGDTAEQSYNRVVDQANEAAAYFGMTGTMSDTGHDRAADLSVLPVLRGVIAEQRSDPDVAMPVFDIRGGTAAHAVWARPDVEALAGKGVCSPDHVLHIKGRPLVLPRKVWEAGRDAIAGTVQAFEADYAAYFDRNAQQSDTPKSMVTPDPKHAWIEGIGIVGIGNDARSAAVAADLAEQNMAVRIAGEDAGGFRPIAEEDQFECEYWPVERAKLDRSATPVLQGRVVMVTGGAGAIGLATARAFAELGANCILVDLDEARLADAVGELGPWHTTHACDITAAGAAEGAMDHAVATFGGLDILVSNAGSATGGAMLELDDAAFRKAFELNFFAHKNFATSAAALMLRQQRPGQILFNISKQAINPGKNMGAYGMPKAATMFLMRQLALELGGDGIRVNGINADRIRSGLLTEDFIKERSAARGVSEADYMGGNLLKREVEARHVGEAFVALALSERTTGHVLTVDGGNTAAELR
ncbi:bifunctional aldolase/short-chain dehydrogenase [Nitratireductor sp. XY-223]|uniref:bifunctional aldolase/short-chain dehydrogenase n=1 Tax=Nitratireductor sp. XY-223 TaxID=2561926 RepID=UPI0010AA4D78|nr:bifunctional aldolase/short-chain dehydrogenase [Nitratireductor sp. XY-223]